VKLRFAALLGLSALAIVGSGGGAAPRTRAEALLDEELGAIAQDAAHPLASLSVLALRGGRVVYERHFGRRFIDPADRARDLAADGNTLYRVASVSKMVVAIAVLRLVDEGKLALDTDVGEYLGYPVRNPHFPDAAITLRMLLTHTSSLRDDGGYNFPQRLDLRDVLTPGGGAHGKGEMWSAHAAPGRWFQYCNLGWGVIGTVVEKATGERFERAARRLVLEPLGMRGGFDPAALPKERVADVATLYRKRAAGDDDQPWNPGGPWIPQVDDYSRAAPVSRADAAYVPGTNATLFGPQGGLRASAADLGRVLRMLANGGALDGRRVLSAAAVAEMTRPQWRREGLNGEADYGVRGERFQAWGLGAQLFTDRSGAGRGDRLVQHGGFTAVGHLGDAYGLTAVAAVDPASGDGLVMLIGGSGFDPDTYPGAYSSLARHEERILTALHRRAILQRAD
jgi:CubicO group peptidase (beta-lactamase class C family)